MKIALLGYGKMGKTIEQLALDKGHEIVLKTSGSSPADEAMLKETHTEVAIEFTRPDQVVRNIEICTAANVPIVTGTTGWFHRLSEVESLVNSNNGHLLYSSNFSIGVNIFFKLNEYLAAIMERYESYDPVITETHHTEKLDSPSGTAITLAEDLIFQLRRKSEWKNDASEEENILSVISHREPNVPGTHEITYQNSIDEISIKHQAKNREGFALGSILAARWLLNQPKGVYSMRDFLKID